MPSWQKIHGTGIFTYIYQQKYIDPTVGNDYHTWNFVGLGKTMVQIPDFPNKKLRSLSEQYTPEN